MDLHYFTVKKMKGNKVQIDLLKKKEEQEFKCNDCLKCTKNKCDKRCGTCGSGNVGGSEVSIRVSVKNGVRVEVQTETTFEQGVKTVIISVFHDGNLGRYVENKFSMTFIGS